MKASKSKRERMSKGSTVGCLLWFLPLSFLGLAAHFYWHAIQALYRHDSLPPPLLRAYANTTTTTATFEAKAHADAAITPTSLRAHAPPRPLPAQPSLPLPSTTPPAPPQPALPGAANHSILSLSAAALSATPLSALLAPYGESDGGGSCPQDFGNALINRWRATRQAYCPASAAASAAPALHTSIDCYLVAQTRHHGHGDNLCHMKNVAVDMGVFADRAVTRPVVVEYVSTQHMKQPYIPFKRGFVKGDCTPDPALWRRDSMPGWNADWTVGAYEQGPAACDEWVEHRVLVVQRDTFANFFHDSEDFVNAMLALAVLNWSLGPSSSSTSASPSSADGGGSGSESGSGSAGANLGTQIYLTDLYPEGPFWDVWSKVFSAGGLPALTAFDLSKKFKGKRVCFRDMAVNIYGPAAPITVASWDTQCKRTAILRGYSDLVIRGMGLQNSTHYAASAPSKRVVVTFLARRASSEWPEKRFCDDINSFFECALWAGPRWGIRSLGRMVKNEADLIAGLKSLEAHAFRNGAAVTVNVVDYNLLSFRDQIATDLGTDLLIGPHGAGLMHSVFMRDRAGLLEIFIDGSGANRHFHNMASWFGRPYHGESSSNPVDVRRIVSRARDMIEAMHLDGY